MIQFRLNHTCNRVGCEGHKGQVVSISEADAQWLEAHGGGSRVAASAAANTVTEESVIAESEDASANTGEENHEHTGDGDAPRKRKRGQ